MDTRYLQYVQPGEDFYVELDGSDDDLGPSGGRRQGVWAFHPARVDLPLAGWKVHVSVIPQRAAAVIDRTVGICRELGIACKHLRSRELVRQTQAKYSSLEAAGKVITCYPVDDEQAEILVESLRAALHAEPGASIPGELRVPGTPIHLRFGAFQPRWGTDPEGHAIPMVRVGDRWIPDVRGRLVPPQVSVPAFIERLQAEASVEESGERLDITQVELLHRSNAGGVYRAVAGDGTPVVLKEARHFTGYDLGGASATDRLRHEHETLCRLKGLGVAPEPLAYESVGSSDFMTMTDLGSASVQKMVVQQHPSVLDDPDPRAFLDWTDQVLAAVHSTLQACHAVGVAHGDVHAGNVVLHDGIARLIDFESASLDGHAVASGVSAVRSGDHAPMPADDLEDLRRMEDFMIQPPASLVAEDDVRGDMVEAGRHDITDLAVEGAGVPSFPGGRSPEELDDALYRGLVSGARTEDPSRPFPGDIVQFARPGAGVGLLHGAAGVCAAVCLSGHPMPRSWGSWILRTVPEMAEHRGLADGLDGVLAALTLVPQQDDLAATVEATWHRLVQPATVSLPWWGSGAAGLAVAAAQVAEAAARPTLWETVDIYVRTLERMVPDGERAPGHRAGLESGWSGVALAMLRVAGLTSDRGMRERCVRLARSCLDLELPFVLLSGGRASTRDAGRRMPHLGIGPCATALGLASLCQRTGEPLTTTEESIVAAVLRGAGQRTFSSGGLWEGRAGQVAVLDHLDPGHPMIEVHHRRLLWHTKVLGLHGGPAAGTAPGRALLGSQGLRCSLDLATGSAGAMAALHPGALGRLLMLPEHR